MNQINKGIHNICKYREFELIKKYEDGVVHRVSFLQTDHGDFRYFNDGKYIDTYNLVDAYTFIRELYEIYEYRTARKQ